MELSFRPTSLKACVVLCGVALLILLPFVLLERTGRNILLNEVRHHTMGVAAAVAAGIDAEALKQVAGEESVGTPGYAAIQTMLDKIDLAIPDIQYMYTMRRSKDPAAPPTMVEFVVDQSPRDHNGNGVIDPEEESELPGAPYDASEVPELMKGFEAPTADQAPLPDAPYPDLLSGYAPIRTDDGEIVGLVGVGIHAKTLSGKLFGLRVLLVLVWVVFFALIMTLYVFIASASKRRIQQLVDVERSSRFDALSSLAAHLAHDLNNSMVSTMGNLELLHDEVKDKHLVRLVDDIQHSLQGASRLVWRLGAFSKSGGNPVFKPLHLQPWLTSLCRLYGRGQGCEIELKMPDHECWVNADESQLGQVMLNLLNNAVQAYHAAGVSGGVVRVRLDPMEVTQGVEGYRIEVNDDGPGIPPENLARIFEPFFTTKETGSGLGLASSRRIVEAHDGRIGAENRWGGGVRVYFILKALPDDHRGRHVYGERGGNDKLSEGAGGAGDNGRNVLSGIQVLVMDDEAVVRQMIARLLTHRGAEVFEVDDGRKAIDKYRELTGGLSADHGKKVVCILDINVLGGMGGIETIQHLRQLYGKVAAVACTGYASADISNEFMEFGFSAYVAKPFRSAELITAIRRAAGLEPLA